jgi:hypothetical protein
MWYAREKRENCNKVLVRKPKGKRPLGISRQRKDDGIRMDLFEIDRGCRLDSVGSE